MNLRTQALGAAISYICSRTLVLLATAVVAFGATDARGQVGEKEARSIAVDAYVYLYPLVTMDVTRRRATNAEAGKSFGRGPANTFVHIPMFPPADFRDVVRPNFDTLYSVAWLDLAEGPVVVSVPDTGGRYYLLPMLDMWSDAFASPGWRTTGTRASTFLIARDTWRPDLGERIAEELRLPRDTQRINAPTPYVWIIGRIKTDGPTDYPTVHKIQAGLTITPLADWGKPARPRQFTFDRNVDMKTPPKAQVDSMLAGQYFTYAAELMKLNPPHSTDQPIIARMKRIGFEVGKSFDIGKADPTVKAALDEAPAGAQELMEWKLSTLARVVNGWSMNTDTMGVYGNYYLKRAIVAREGLGANLPEDAVYPLNLADEGGQPLDGSHKYTIHLSQAVEPPVEAFWSITLYDQDGFQVANKLNRFAISSWMPLRRNPDGSLTLYVQDASPGAAREANWLPAPKGRFNLTMRLYAPRPEVLTGRWSPPPVVRSPAGPGLIAQ